MSQTDKTRVRLALIVALFAVAIPAIATAQPEDHPQASTSPRAVSTISTGLLPAAYSNARTFWDGGEAARLAYLASLERTRARARSAAGPLRLRARLQIGTGGSPGVVSSGQPDWYATAACESGGRWDINSGNGYWGGLQFAPSTWFAYGGGPFDGTGPFPYSSGEQIAVAERVFAAQGPSAWPSCFRWK